MKTLITATLGLVLTASTGYADDLAGYDKFTFDAPHRAEIMAASIWYPAGRKTYQGMVGENAIFKGSKAYVGAAIADGTFPLLILSHGSGGNMDTISWLSSGLAQNGIMILAMNHPGSTSGDSSPRRSIKVWERARDLTALLDAFLADDPLARNVDQNRIYSLGFSLGGLTALHLAGLRTDKQAYVNYCDTFGEAAQDCLFFKKGGVEFDALPKSEFNSVLRDERISAAIAIEPGMSYAFQQETVEGNELPIQLINFGDKNSRWKAIDMGPNGSDLGAKLANATYVEIKPGSHFSFLAECKPGAEKLLKAEGEDPICSDPAGTDRADLHKAVIETIIGFVE